MSLASNLGVHIWQSLEMPVYDLTIEPKGHARRWHCLRNRKVESVMQESGQKRKINSVSRNFENHDFEGQNGQIKPFQTYYQLS